jgi:hypothetical protein
MSSLKDVKDNICYPHTTEALTLATLLCPFYEHITAYNLGVLSAKFKQRFYLISEMMVPALKGGISVLCINSLLESMGQYDISGKTTSFLVAAGAGANIVLNYLANVAGQSNILEAEIPEDTIDGLVLYGSDFQKTYKRSKKKVVSTK